MKRNPVVPLIAAALTLCFQAEARNYALSFSRIDGNPVSLGTASSDMASDGNAAYASRYNIASLPYYDGIGDVAVSYSSWAPSSVAGKFLNAGAGFHIGRRWGLGASLAYDTGRSYEMIDMSGSPSGSFRTSSFTLSAGLAFKAAEFLSLGVSFKYASETLSPSSRTGAFNADLTAMFHFAGMNVCAGISSLGPDVKSSSGAASPQPSAVALGVFYPWHISENHRLDFSADSDIFLKGGVEAAAGIQYDWKRLLFLRAGYHYGNAESVIPSYASAGLGVKFFGVHIDAAYLFGNDVLGKTFTIGLGYSF